jgi:glycosyltransferase involved in cell wall biosynthesis
MIIGLYPELQAVGGVQRAGCHFAVALALAAQMRGMASRHLSLNDPRGDHELSVGKHHVGYRGFGRRKRGFVAAALTTIVPRRGIVFAAHVNLAPLAMSARLIPGRLKTVVVAHGIEMWTPLPARRRLALQAAQLVLATSRHTADKVVAVQGVAASRVRRVPLAVDPALLPSAGDVTDRADDAPPTVLTVSRLESHEGYKGVGTLIEALRDVPPPVRLMVVGDGDDRPRLERLARDLGLQERIRFLGTLPPPALAAAYHDCDVFALPSSGEGFGLVYVEAMAHGKAIVAAGAGGAADIVEDGVTGLLAKPLDAASVAAALRRLFAEPRLRAALGQRGRALAVARYSFEAFQGRVADCVDELCAS